MSEIYQNHVERRISEINERRKKFRGRKKCNVKSGN
jgi:hypothetical protein